jgi:hypothetical protein
MSGKRLTPRSFGSRRPTVTAPDKLCRRLKGKTSPSPPCTDKTDWTITTTPPATPHRWDSRRTAKAQRLHAGSAHSKGKVIKFLARVASSVRIRGSPLPRVRQSGNSRGTSRWRVDSISRLTAATIGLACRRKANPRSSDLWVMSQLPSVSRGLVYEGSTAGIPGTIREQWGRTCSTK